MDDAVGGCPSVLHLSEQIMNCDRQGADVRASSIFCHHHQYRLCNLHTSSKAIANESAKTNHELRSGDCQHLSTVRYI
ncbi:MAG: hypothetical protein SAL70_40285 [Scytonema sp. PMC 1070.18]|nr:hypothetical protein [Scytonema sp. PMC 1070.18]